MQHSAAEGGELREDEAPGKDQRDGDAEEGGEVHFVLFGLDDQHLEADEGRDCKGRVGCDGFSRRSR